MAVGQSVLRKPHTVTFDCWATLLYEAESSLHLGASERPRLVSRVIAVDEQAAATALRQAWEKHQRLWHRREIFTGVDITRDALRALGAKVDRQVENDLVEALETEILGHEVRALEGARKALERLAEVGVRRALICDTGFTPGRVVRELLDRVGLLELLEVTIFSDEIGAPKPDPRTFAAALGGLRVAAHGAVHVGDLRRSDVAGAKSAGMGAVRLRAHNDDSDADTSRKAGVIDCVTAGCDPTCPRPEADAVADSFDHMLEILDWS